MNISYELAALLMLPAGLFFIAFFIAKSADQLIVANRFFSNSPNNERVKKDDKISRYFNEEKSVHLDKVIHGFLVDKKPFLRQRYSLGEMSRDLDIPLHYLSAFINRYYNMNFNDLINRYRVCYSKLMI